MKNITVVERSVYLCNLCNERHSKMEVQVNSVTRFALCKTCAKKLNECLIERLSDKENKKTKEILNENKLLRSLLKDAYSQAHSEFTDETSQAIEKFFGSEEIENLFL